MGRTLCHLEIKCPHGRCNYILGTSEMKCCVWSDLTKSHKSNHWIAHVIKGLCPLIKSECEIHNGLYLKYEYVLTIPYCILL